LKKLKKIDKIIKYFDLFSAFLVILCLILKFKYDYVWILYGTGCLFFSFINIYKKLPGQAIMNLIATIIAIRNYIN